MLPNVNPEGVEKQQLQWSPVHPQNAFCFDGKAIWGIYFYSWAKFWGIEWVETKFEKL